MKTLKKPDFLEESGSFLRNLQEKGALEIKDCEDPVEDQHFRRKSSVFEAEMHKFLQQTFERPETPPFYSKCELAAGFPTKKHSFSRKSEKSLQNGVFFDEILQQYYDSQKNEYFKLI